MRAWTMVDYGSECTPEDGNFLRYPFFGVSDGTSGLYVPSEGPRFFQGRSGGQMLSDTILQIFATAHTSAALEDLLLLANKRVLARQNKAGIREQESDALAGATFAIAKLNATKVIILQAGDCFALWGKRDGSLGVTSNQMFEEDMERRRIIAELMRKNNGDRDQMWRDYLPIAKARKVRCTNIPGTRGHGLLNGQPTLASCWKKVILLREELKFLLLFTDGLIYYPDSGDPSFAVKTAVRFQTDGLPGILRETRRKEEQQKSESHIDHGEATALVIEF